MLRIDRRLLAHIEWPLLILALLVTGVGLLTILSATFHDGHLMSPYVVRQASWAGLGLIGMVVAVSIDYRTLNRYAYPIYGLLLAALVLVLGDGFAGTRRLPPIR